jgi:hypothetical protein
VHLSRAYVYNSKQQVWPSMDIAEVIARSPWFAGLSASALAPLVAAAQIKKYPVNGYTVPVKPLPLFIAC